MSSACACADSDSTRFRLRLRRAGWVSFTGSLCGHLFAITLLASSVAELVKFTRARAERGHGASPAPRGHAREPEAAGYVQMVELPPPPRATGRKSGNLPPGFYRRLMERGIKDAQGMSLAELRRRLQALTGQAAGVSDASLSEIGRFLGMRPNRYRVRTRYKDELNPNINFHQAEVVRAFRFRAREGAAGYTITLADRERDEFTFTLAGEAARELERGGLLFKDRVLAGEAGANAFQLAGARVEDIATWRARNDPAGRGGSIVTLRDKHGRRRRFHVRGRPDAPLVMARLAFVRRPDGSYLYDPKSEATIFTSLLDSSSLTLWSVSRVKSGKPGVPRAKVVMLDKKGNRMIYFVEGEQAREFLARAGVLDPKSVTGRIYRKTGLAGYLLDMYKQKGK